jgi:hypothetical protein
VISLNFNLRAMVDSKIAGSVLAIKQSLLLELAQATPVDTGLAQSSWRLDDRGDIVNDVPYISELDAGHSQQAPSYFIETTVLSNPNVHPNGTIVVDTDSTPS